MKYKMPLIILKLLRNKTALFRWWTRHLSSRDILDTLTLNQILQISFVFEHMVLQHRHHCFYGSKPQITCTTYASRVRHVKTLNWPRRILSHNFYYDIHLFNYNKVLYIPIYVEYIFSMIAPFPCRVGIKIDHCEIMLCQQGILTLSIIAFWSLLMIETSVCVQCMSLTQQGICWVHSKN